MIGTTRRWVGIATVSMMAIALLATGPSASATRASRSTLYDFPSATSVVVASAGFINACEVGFFRSHSMDDLVRETFAGPSSITRVKLVVVVVQNDLNAGRHVSWALSINGIDVARFRVNSGVTGTLIPTASFAPIHGLNYSFKIRVTNDVPQGEGSISLAYACYTHGIAVS